MTTASLSGLLERLDRVQRRIEAILNQLSGIAIMSVLAIVVAEVAMRALFNTPIPGQIDMVELILPCVALLGLAYCHQKASHVRMGALLAMLTGRRLWIAELCNTVPTIFLFGVLTWGSWTSMTRAYVTGDSTMEVEIITWPAKLAICLAIFVLLLRLVLQFFGYLRLFQQPDAKLLGVPEQMSLDEFVQSKAAESVAATAAPIARQKD
jgi:C4-dicarboxylate transporter DctQ subunit